MGHVKMIDSRRRFVFLSEELDNPKRDVEPHEFRCFDPLCFSCNSVPLPKLPWWYVEAEAYAYGWGIK